MRAGGREEVFGSLNVAIQSIYFQHLFLFYLKSVKNGQSGIARAGISRTNNVGKERLFPCSQLKVCKG